MSLLFLVVLAYVALQLAIGAWLSRRVSSKEDYLLGGRRLGLTLVTASMFATWFGAEACVGSASEVYEHGASAVSADPFGYGVSLVLFGLLVAAPLRRRGYTTLADLFAERFSGGVERLVAVLLIPGSVLWAAAQIRAFGHVFASTSETLTPNVGIAVAALLTIAYTTAGGLLADVYTDLLQASILVVALVAITAVAFLRAEGLGGFSAETLTLSSEQPRLVVFNAWAIPIAGSLFAQELVSRAVAAKTPEIARRGAFLSGALYLAIGLLPVLLGLLARDVLGGAALGENVLAEMARRYLGEFGFVIFVGALISAILSTVDSALLACGALIVQNLIPAVGLAGSQQSKLRAARLCVALLGLVAYALANASESVHSLVEEASAFGSAGVVVAGLFGMFTRVGGPRSAAFALIGGASTYFWAEHVSGSEGSYVWSLAAALGGYLVGSVGQRARKVVPDAAL